MKENLCIFTGHNLTDREKKKHQNACHLSVTETHEPPACLHLLQNIPYPEGFLPRSLPPQDSVTAIALTEFSERFCS